jgi:hypothetical protein
VESTVVASITDVNRENKAVNHRHIHSMQDGNEISNISLIIAVKFVLGIEFVDFQSSTGRFSDQQEKGLQAYGGTRFTVLQ